MKSSDTAAEEALNEAGLNGKAIMLFLKRRAEQELIDLQISAEQNKEEELLNPERSEGYTQRV
jgi:hypothetical protein